jgi:hypothetical protein
MVAPAHRATAIKEARLSRLLVHPNIMPIMDMCVRFLPPCAIPDLLPRLELTTHHCVLVQPYGCRGDLFAMFDEGPSLEQATDVSDMELFKYIGHMVCMLCRGMSLLMMFVADRGARVHALLRHRPP